MAREFNYRRAHREYAQPAFDALPQGIKDLYALVVKHASDLSQAQDLCVYFRDDNGNELTELRAAFEEFGSDELIQAAEVIYYWGHWAHTSGATISHPGATLPDEVIAFDDWEVSPERDVKERVKQIMAYAVDETKPVIKHHRAGPNNRDEAGAYWKFQALARTLARERKEPGSAYKVDKFDCEPFMDHKPGTGWTLDEMPALFAPKLAGLFEVVGAQHVNFKPHPFVIGPRHMQGESMFLDPRSAPCAHRDCCLSYDEHTSDTVLFLKVTRDLTNKEAAEALSSVKELMEEHKLDGFAFIESKYTIAPPEGETVAAK